MAERDPIRTLLDAIALTAGPAREETPRQDSTGLWLSSQSISSLSSQIAEALAGTTLAVRGEVKVVGLPTTSTAAPTPESIRPLPHLAAGGIVDRPTVAVLGEAGPEAVVPGGSLLRRLLSGAGSALGSLPGVPVMAAGIGQRSPSGVVKGLSELVGSIFRDPHEETFEGALSQHTLPAAALLARLAAGAAARTQKALGFAAGGTVPFAPSKAKIQPVAEEISDDFYSTLEKLLGGDARPKHLASLVGAPDDATIKVLDASEDTIDLRVDHPKFTAYRTLHAAEGKRKAFIENESFFMKSGGGTGTGLGTEVLARQAQFASEAGFSHIETLALRTNEEDDPAVGYYVWPRLGYNAPVSAIDWGSGARGESRKKEFDERFPGARTLQDVMATSEGRDWWREHGNTIDRMIFGLTPGASAMERLAAYRAGKTPLTMAEGGIVGDAFKPRGTDTVPAMLTPGERVISRSDSERHKEELDRIQRGAGKPVAYLQHGTAPGPTPPAPPGGPAPSFPIPLPIVIAGPFPLPVTGGTGGGPTGGGPTGGPRKKEDFDSLTDTIRKFAGASTLAFGAVSAGLAGLARAASPALFQTLTQSAELLAATLGSALVEPVLALSFKIQELANWVRQLDPALKAQIGTWAGWTAGILGAVVVVTKLVGLAGNLLPILTGLKAAMVFTVTNPFGLLLAGLGAMAAFHPESFKGIGEALSGSFADLAGSMGSVMPMLSAFADLMAGVLTPVLNMAADAIRLVTAAVLTFQAAVGPTAASITLLGAGLLAFGGSARVIVAVVGTVIAVLSQLGPVGQAAAVGMLAAAAAVKLLGVAMLATPIGITITAIAALAAGVYALGAAYRYSGDEATAAAAKIDRSQARMEKIKKGGKVTEAEVLEELSPEEKKAYHAAKTPEARKRVLETAGKAAETAEGIPAAESGKVLAAFEVAIKAAKGFPLPALAVGPQVYKELGETDLSNAAKLGVLERLRNPKMVGLLGDLATEKGDMSAANLAKLKAFLDITGVGATTKAATIKSALASGMDLEGVKEAGDFDSPRAKRLKALSGLAGVAFQKEMAPQQMEVGQVRGMVQNLGLAMNPIEQKILDENRETNIQIREYLRKTLEQIEKNTR